MHDANCTTMLSLIKLDLPFQKLFANRDFVYTRRTFVDKKCHLMVIVNQSTKHPNCPEEPKNQRVNDYWSYMVIKPKTTFRKSGLEFVVTYFDNPGIVMPPTVTTWVARIYMPDFLNKLHQATLRYATGKDLSLEGDERFNDDMEDVNGTDFFWNYCPDPGFEYPAEGEVLYNTQTNVRTGGGGDDSGKTSRKVKREVQSESADQEENVGREDENESETETEEIKNTRTSWWSYLHPYSYFA